MLISTAKSMYIRIKVVLWLITAIRMGWSDGLDKITSEWGKGESREEGRSRLMEHEMCTWEIPEIPWP